jgi:hypothetical protein
VPRPLRATQIPLIPKSRKSCPPPPSSTIRVLRAIRGPLFSASLSPSAFSVQRSTFSVQRSTFSVQRSKPLPPSCPSWFQSFYPKSFYHPQPPPSVPRPLRATQIPLIPKSRKSCPTPLHLPFVSFVPFAAPFFLPSIFLPVSVLQRSTFNVQRSAFSVQRSAFKVQRSNPPSCPSPGLAVS